ncbi:MAG TPA: SDR family oxidoreductase [Hadesarchaea archaeon]|nr:SDR family oxidoreductase [Hadesarchaea archaeon]
MFGLDGKIAIVTGGMGLLGREFVKTLKAAGSKVAIFDINVDRCPKEFEHVIKDENVAVYRVDVTYKKSVKNALNDIIKKWGRPNILVNSAAIDVPPDYTKKSISFKEYPEGMLDKIMDVNLKGTFLCSQIIGASMAEEGGSIINISSIYGEVSPDQRIYEKKGKKETFIKPVSYCISKGAISNLTRYLATYWAKKNIRVNCLTFGGVFNNQDREFVENYSSRVPMGRMARRDEYNGAILFLASDASSYMTGANIVIDGGYTAW